MAPTRGTNVQVQNPGKTVSNSGAGEGRRPLDEKNNTVQGQPRSAYGGGATRDSRKSNA